MAINFSIRSNELELMDLPIESAVDLFINLKELTKINQLTGGPAVTFKAIKALAKKSKRELHIVDIGFGGGDMLHHLLKHQNELPCPIKLTGIDLMPEAKTFALQAFPDLAKNVQLEICDYKDWFARGGKADIITAGLFCHHLSDEMLIDFFKDIKQNARLGAVINDLHRSPIAYYFIKAATSIFSKSRFTKNDAPLSVLRAFRRDDFRFLLDEAGIKNYRLNWKWAFRFLLTIDNSKIHEQKAI
jgi:2-polyprenyl-3-methyl-5-hydroxy-6-metoxy-1,4-benzoquinol methylase